MSGTLPCPTCGADLAPSGADLRCRAGHSWRWDTASGMPALVRVVDRTDRGSAPAPVRAFLTDSPSAPTEDPRPAPVGEVRYSRASARPRSARMIADVRPAQFARPPTRLERLVLRFRLVRQLVDPAEPCPYCPVPVFSRRPMAHTRRVHPIGGSR